MSAHDSGSREGAKPPARQSARGGQSSARSRQQAAPGGKSLPRVSKSRPQKASSSSVQPEEKTRRDSASYARRRQQKEALYEERLQRLAARRQLILQRRIVVGLVMVLVAALLGWLGFIGVKFFVQELKQTPQAKPQQQARDLPDILPTPGPCNVGDLDTQVTHSGVYAGEQQIFSVKFKNNGAYACLLDAGRNSLRADITSGQTRVARTSVCAGNDKRLLLLDRADELTLNLLWDGHLSPTTCGQLGNPTQPGTYRADVYLGQTKLTPEPLGFVLQAPPDPSAQPSGIPSNLPSAPAPSAPPSH